MRNSTRRFVLAAVLSLVGGGGAARADLIVAPNANEFVPGNNQQFLVLDTGAATFQWAYAASEFNPPGPAIPLGTPISSIGFRLPSNGTTITVDINYSQFDIQISTPSVPIGSLGSNFAANQGSDVVMVKSGPLTIPAGSLVDLPGSGVNPFYDIAFTTPFIYTGGDLLFTIRHSNSGVMVSVDANSLAPPLTLTNTVGIDSNTATTGIAAVFNSPITSLDFSGVNAVPEPSTLAAAATGVLMALGSAWRRCRRAAA